MPGPYDVQPSERTEIIRGSVNVIEAGLKIYLKRKNKD